MNGRHTPCRALQTLLRDRPDALVAALSSEGRLVPMPPGVPVGSSQTLDGSWDVGLVAEGHLATIADAWRRAQTEPVVRVAIQLAAGPDAVAAVHLFDLRSEHGVHVVAVEVDDPARFTEPTPTPSGRRRGAAKARKDGLSVFLEVDAATEAMLGWARDDLVGHSTTEFVHPDDVDAATASWMAMRAGGGSGRARLRFRHAQGHYVWLEVTNDNRLDDEAEPCVLSEMVDVSEEMAQIEALRQREQLLARLAEALPVGICHLRTDGFALFSNTPLVALLGEVDGAEALLRAVAVSDRAHVDAALADAFRGKSGRVEVGINRPTRELRCELTFRALAGDEGEVDGVIVCAFDVTDTSRLRAELEHRASHDALTGCLNRAATVAALERALIDGRPVAVAYIDLDDFKTANDKLGHAAGDEMLRVTAARLRGATRSVDAVGRIGGDEFVVIVRQGRRPLDAASLASRLRDAINGDVVFGGQRLPLQASIGVATSDAADVDADDLLHQADLAMYETKHLARTASAMANGAPTT